MITPLSPAISLSAPVSTRGDVGRPVDARTTSLSGTIRPRTVMIVDDEALNIKAVQKHLTIAGHQSFVSTTDPREAIGLLRREEPDVLILDVMMPEINGLDVLASIRSDAQLCHLPVLILTAATDQATKVRALELGATDFLNKPINPSELIPRVRNALIVKAHHDHMVEYSSHLEDEVRKRTAELAESRLEVIQILASAAEYRDQETGNHVIRVGKYAGVIARALGFSNTEAEQIELAAILHDVGKIGITDTILLKPGRLDPTEMATMRHHCQYGANILQGTRSSQKSISNSRFETVRRSPVLKLAAKIAIGHHEKWDGSGYPNGIAGDAIPIEARITSVADVFDALGSRRPYKEPKPPEECFAILEQGRGKDFDPQVLDAFFASTAEITKIARDLADG